MGDRDIDQAITALKKGAYLLKYGRRGKPKFCPFQLSNEETALIWYSGKKEKQLRLDLVSKIIPGQRTAIFRRYPRPDKEYQSFSLIYGDRSLDLICKDKDEAEVWLAGIRALINRRNCFQKWRAGIINSTTSSETSHAQKSCSAVTPFVRDSSLGIPDRAPAPLSLPHRRLGKAFSEIIQQTAAAKTQNEIEATAANSITSLTSSTVESTNQRTSTSDNVRISLSSAVSSSSQSSFPDDFDALGDVYIWGESTGNGFLGGGSHKINNHRFGDLDGNLPKVLNSTIAIDVHKIACGRRHAVLVNRQGEAFSWGEGSGGRLGHGLDTDISHPKLIQALAGMSVELIACGEHHACAVTSNGDLYSWGDGSNENGTSHWTPKMVGGVIGGLRITCVSCGPWHTAMISSTGKLFTFGDGSFGVLGHGDCSSTTIPREVDTLKGLRTLKVACGIWHTAAVVEAGNEAGDHGGSFFAKLFTWGQGDKGRLGNGDSETRLIPVMVSYLSEKSISQIACGYNLTVALTAAGEVYTMGSTAYGQLGSPKASGQAPHLVGGKLGNCFVEEIACGAYHIAVLTSKGEVFTWGKGGNGQLGHGDNKNRNTATVVSFLKEKQVKTVACGANFTAVVCAHKSVSSSYISSCSGCRSSLNFRRKRHNCYNCGLVFCNVCTGRRSLGAALAPKPAKPYRVCEECYTKLQKERVPSLAGASHKPVEAADKVLQSQLSSLSAVDSASRCSGIGRNNLGRGRGRGRNRGNRVLPVTPTDLRVAAVNVVKNLRLRNPSTEAVLSDFSSTSELTSPPSQPASTNSCRLIESLREEITHLKAKVEELTSKSERLETELRRKSHLAYQDNDEEGKCKPLKVFEALDNQLNEIADRQPERCSSDEDFLATNEFSSDLRHPSGTDNDQFDGSLVNLQNISNGSDVQKDMQQRLIQAHQGVFITLSPLPGGFNELKRIRFRYHTNIICEHIASPDSDSFQSRSRKHYTEREAEKWWADNGSMLIEQYNIRYAR